MLLPIRLSPKSRLVQVSSGGVNIVGCGFPKKQKVDLRIVDVDTCVELGENCVGEIWVRSESKANGYFGNEEATMEGFRAALESVDEKVDEKNEKDEKDEKDQKGEKDEKKSAPNDKNDPAFGYLRTGDLGFLHNEEIFICGRLKDLMIVRGRNHYPQDLESTTENLSDEFRPGCCAAFTLDQLKSGVEEVCIAIEVRDTKASKIKADDMIASIRTAINKDHGVSVDHVVLLNPRTIPKTTSGKIARAWCRKAFINDSFQVLKQQSFVAADDGGGGGDVGDDNCGEKVNENRGISMSSMGSSSRIAIDPESIRSLTAEEIRSRIIKGETVEYCTRRKRKDSKTNLSGSMSLHLQTFQSWQMSHPLASTIQRHSQP